MTMPAQRHNPLIEPIGRREYRMAGMWRRIPIYIALGGVGFMCIISIAGKFRIAHPPYPPLVFFFGSASILALIQQSWKIRIDDQGISRHRFLMGWDHFSWEDFAAGRIGRGMAISYYVNQSHPFGRRTLDLEWLRPEDQHEIHSLISRFLKAPAIELPEVITFRTGLGLTTWRISADGLTIRSLRQWQTYSWDQVLSVEIIRLTHQHDDFRNLTIRLSDRELKLRNQLNHGVESRSWSGVSGAHIAAMMLHYTPKDRLKVFAISGPPQNMKEALMKLERVRKKIKELKTAFWVNGVVGAILPILGLIEWYSSGYFINAVPFFIVYCLCIPLSYLVPGIMYRNYVKLARKLEQWHENSPKDEEWDEKGLRTDLWRRDQ